MFRDHLPVRRVVVGDTIRPGSEAQFSLGPLRCSGDSEHSAPCSKNSQSIIMSDVSCQNMLLPHHFKWFLAITSHLLYKWIHLFETADEILIYEILNLDIDLHK